MPSNTVVQVYNQLISPDHKVSRGSIGVEFNAIVNPAVQRVYGVSSGVTIANVTPNGPAQKAGLQTGDTIVSVNGKTVATGDELVAAGTPPGPAQLVDSNSPMLAAAVREAGGEPTFLGIARDSKDSVRALLEAASASDLVVSSAGVSVGDHDWVREVAADLGTISTWRVAMRPGKPVLIGKLGDAVFIGLPGNPVSSSVTFELFARPVIRLMQGANELHRQRMRVRIGEEMSKPAGLETYTRAVLRSSRHDDLPLAHSSGDQGSSMLRSLTRADCLLVLPADIEVIEAGAIVEAIPLR
jgi:molybdopterin molybdotransferase